MEAEQITVIVERAGMASRPRTGVAGTDVVRLVNELEGQRDTTVSVELEGVEEKLLLAVDGQLAFLALERPDGLLQFSRMDAGTGTHPFTIGGQEADIEDRYLLDIESAAVVVHEWMLAGEESSLGSWERQ